MISLYEGILRGMEDTLSDGGVAAAVIAANEPNSDFRKMFSGADYGDAFSMTEENGKNVFTVTTNSSNGSWIECSKHKLSDLFDGVETVKIIGGARIIAPDNNIKDALCKTIIADNISIHQATEVKDVELFVKNLAQKRVIPNMQFDTSVKRLSNCRLEIDTTNSIASRAIFYSLPEFDNVTSDTMRHIDITDNPIKFNGVKPHDIMSDKRFKDIFEFGYDLSYYNGSVTIKDMKSLKKLITSKDFYNREFSEWPYRLKKGVKLSDFIDISQFKELRTLMITDSKMGIIFANTQIDMHTPYFVDMLKQTWNSKKKGHSIKDIVNLIPVTDDGWRVILFRR